MPVNLSIDGNATAIEGPRSGIEFFADRKNVVALRSTANSRTWRRISRPFPRRRRRRRRRFKRRRLNILRHSTAHVLAQAVQQVFPDANLGIGPFITEVSITISGTSTP